MQSAIIAAAFAALATSVAAQASTTIPPSMPPSATAGFNIAPVSSEDRSLWCLAQRNNCPLICGGSFSLNTCDETSLNYECICPNGTVPDVSAYRDTVPFYICEETFNQCIEANPDDREGQDSCTENQQCGSLNATAAEDGSSDSSTSSAASPTTTSASAASGSGSPSSGASAAPSGSSVAISQQVPTAALALVFSAAIKFLL